MTWATTIDGSFVDAAAADRRGWSPLPTSRSLEEVSDRSTRLRFQPPPSAPGAVGFVLRLVAGRAWTLHGDRILRPLEREVVPPFPVGCLVVVEAEGRLRLVDLRFGRHLHLAPTPGGVTATIVVHDPERTGLAHWRPLTAPAGPVEVSVHDIDELDDVVWLEPYEGGARAAVCLTDHADHDTVAVWRPLRELFARHRIRLTKSVFPMSEPTLGKHEPGLDDPEMRRIAEDLLADGSEVAYHSFGPRARVPSVEEAVRLAALMAELGTTTWIDHGRGTHNFAADDTVPGLGSLSAFLGDHGVRNLWSHLDVAENPFSLRSSWEPVRIRAVVADGVRSTAVLRSARPRVVAYEALHAVNNLLGVEGVVSLRRRQPGALRRMGASVREIRALQRRPVLLYGPGGAMPEVGADGTWVFDTVLLNHVAAALRPSEVDRLAAGSGLLLAHCYLGAAADYMVGHTTASDGLLPELITAVEHLADRQSTHDVVTTGFADLRRHLEAFWSTTLLRTGSGWSLRSASGHLPTVAAHPRWCPTTDVTTRHAASRAYLQPSPSAVELELVRHG